MKGAKFMEEIKQHGQAAQQPEGCTRRFRWPDRKTWLKVAAVLLVLGVLPNLVQTLMQTMQKQQLEAATPEALFLEMYPGGFYLGAPTDGETKFMVGVTAEMKVVCYLLQETETGWRASRELAHSKMLAQENAMLKTAKLYRNAAVETEVIVILKFRFYGDSEDVLGAEPDDTAGTEFQCATLDGAVGQSYYYFAAVDADAEGYQLTPW